MALKFLKLKAKSPQEEFPEDVDRIVSVMAKHGYFCPRVLAEHVWTTHSEESCAGWLYLYGDDESLFNTIMQYVEEDSQ